MALRIGVDAWNLPSDRRGIGRYVREIVGAWHGFGKQRVEPVLIVPERNVLFARRRYLREIGFDLRVIGRGKEAGLDAVWFPWNGMSWISSVPAVATLHDASLFSMPPTDPQVSEREQRPFRVAASKAVRIITDSAFSRAELAMHLKIDPADIDVVHLGVSQVFAEREPAVQSSRRTPYLLYVGALEARKGFFTLLDALKLLPTFEASAVDVVLAGPGTKRQVFPTVGESRIRSVGWVDDQALARLYREALALVYPSEYEGYGLPIVEAMAAGTPAVAADTPSSREAGGSAAVYFPPGDALTLAKVIASVAAAPADVRADIRRRGEEHARSRTWDDTAQQTLGVFERALGSARVESLRDS